MRLGNYVLAVGLVAAAPLAWGHAVLLQGTPAAGAEVQGPSIPVSLRFNSRIDGRRSRLILVGLDGKEQLLPVTTQSAPDTIGTELRQAKPGLCRIRWQVLATDGHITRGELKFHVK